MPGTLIAADFSEYQIATTPLADVSARTRSPPHWGIVSHRLGKILATSVLRLILP
jgi:hypothetical protein